MSTSHLAALSVPGPIPTAPTTAISTTTVPTKPRFSRPVRQLGLRDELSFGKYKGTAIDTVVKGDPGWLVWLREEKKKKGESDILAPEVHALLDQAIRISKPLRGKYRTWDIPLPDASVAPVMNPVPTAAPSETYSAWGEF